MLIFWKKKGNNIFVYINFYKNTYRKENQRLIELVGENWAKGIKKGKGHF